MLRACCTCCRGLCCGDGHDANGSPGNETPRSGRSSEGARMSTWSSSPLRGYMDNHSVFHPHNYDRLLSLEVQRKLVVLGFRGVGKSALIARFVEDQFLETYEPTIEYTFRTTLLRNSVRFVCDVIDTAAQDEYSSLSRQACVGVHGYILVYSSTSRTSFEDIKVIHDKVTNVIGGATIPMILVATKLDMEEYREVLAKEGQALADLWGYPFVECSAKANVNVDAVFSMLLAEVEKESGLLAEEPKETCALL